jgi:hypothetical protein
MVGIVYPLFVVLIERAEVHFCPDVLNDDYQNVSCLLSTLGSPATSVKALAYLSYGYKRTGCIRASTFLRGSLTA